MSFSTDTATGRNESQARENRLYRWLSIGLFLIAGVTSVLTFSDYSISWDEFYRWRGGQEKLLYYQTLFSGGDASAVLPQRVDNYPGLFDLSVAVLAEYTPFGILTAGHMLSLLLGILTVIGAWAIGRLLGGDRLAFWCALFLLLMPRFYGHIFFNPKDIPFAAGMTWSLFTILWWGARLPKPSVKSTIVLGVVLGLTFSFRIGGLVALLYVVTYAGYSLLARLYRERSITRDFWQDVARLAALGVLIGFVSWLVLIPWWPAMHANPLFKPFEVLQTISQYPWDGHVLFQGKYVLAKEAPWHYPLTWLGITLPDFIYVVLLAGLIVLLSRTKALFHSLLTPQGFPWLIVLLAVCFPVFYVIVKDSILYDGIRHLLFIFPPLACLAALGWIHFLDYLKARQPFAPVVALVVISLLILLQIAVMVRLHPYQYVYFNQISGGIGSKQTSYENEYWGTSLREASDWLAASLPPREEPYRVFSNQPYWLVAMFFPDSLYLVRRPDNAEFYISLTRLGMDDWIRGEELHAVERMGLRMAVVKDLRSVPPEERNQRSSAKAKHAVPELEGMEPKAGDTK